MENNIFYDFDVDLYVFDVFYELSYNNETKYCPDLDELQTEIEILTSEPINPKDISIYKWQWNDKRMEYECQVKKPHLENNAVRYY